MRRLLILLALASAATKAQIVQEPDPQGSNPSRVPDPRLFDAGQPMTDEEAALDTAKAFFDGLANARPQELAAYVEGPGYIEGHYYETTELLRTAWAQALARRGPRAFEVLNIDLLTPAQMEKKHGKPPDRLRAWPWRQSSHLIAVANLSGHPAIVLLKRVGPQSWRVTAFTD